MKSIQRRYVTLAQFAQDNSLSISTVRRRVRDGSILAVQPGGPRTRILILADAMDGAVTPSSTLHQTADVPPPQPTLGHTSQAKKLPGRGPRWMED